jgi:hypothetical protein
MAASRQAIWELKQARSESTAVSAGRANFWSKARKFVLIGAQALFALGVYSYVAWCVLR